jgi:hypothetical protein
MAMEILIACEYSGIVRDAFSRRGHSVMSCDLLPSESPGDHHVGNVLELLRSRSFDFVIGFPPCTYLSKAQQHMYESVPGREYQANAAVAFFKKLFNSAPAVALENPSGYLTKAFRPPDQIVQPWHFGNSHRKEICLWLKNVPPLISTCYSTRRRPVSNHTNSRMTQMERGKIRSRFFVEVAEAMATQWSEKVITASSSFSRSI